MKLTTHSAFFDNLLVCQASLLVSTEHPAGAGKSNISMASVYITDRGVNTTNLYSNNPTVERHAGRLLPIAELLRDPQATLSEVRRIQEVSRRRLAAQQAELTTKQLELLVERITVCCGSRRTKSIADARQQHLAFQRSALGPPSWS
jgi:hypothetical protein